MLLHAKRLLVNGGSRPALRVLHFGEVKTGLFSRLTKNQKVVYAAINAGKVFLTNSIQAAEFGLKISTSISSAKLTLHAAENSRAWKQVGRLLPSASRQTLGKIATIVGGATATGFMLFFEMTPYDPISDLMMSCPQCSPSASYKIY